MNQPTNTALAALRSLRIAACLAVVLASAGVELAGAEFAGTGESTGGPASFRRVYVPADRPDAWPTSGQRYLPIEKGRLDALLRPESDSEMGARADSIELSATLDASGGLVGEGVIEVRAPGRRETLLAWPNDSLAITGERWLPPVTADALLGDWLTREGAKPRHGLAVKESGRIAFDFVAAPAGAATPGRFRLPMPASLDRRLTLRLPNGVVPKAASAIVERLDADEKQPPDDSEGVAWLVRPQVGSDWVVELNDRRAQAPPRPINFSAAIDVVARATPAGIEVRAEIELSSEKTLPAEASIIIAPGGAVQRVTVDGTDAGWVADGAEASSQAFKVDLRLRKQTNRARIGLSLWAPVRLGETWDLAPPKVLDALLEQGTLSVVAEKGVVVADIPVIRHAVYSPRPSDALAAAGEEAFRFQMLNGDSFVRLKLEAEENALALRAETSSELRETEVRSRVKILATGDAASRTEPVTFLVGPEWIVESVEGEGQPSPVEGWRLEPTRDDRQRLVIQLRPAASGSSRVAVVCRRPVPSDRVLAVADLAPLSASAEFIRANLLKVSTSAPLGMRLVADANEAASLRAGGRRQLVDEFEVDLMPSADARQVDTIKVRLDRRPRRYSTQFAVEAELASDGLSYRAEIVFDGDGDLPETLPVYFGGPSLKGARWTEASSGESVDVKSSGESRRRRENQSNAGETWLIRPPARGEGLVRVVVEAKLPAAAPLEVPLPLAPNAASQTGRIALSGPGVTQRQIDTRGLVAQPTTKPDTLLYTYEPPRVVDFRQRTRLVINAPARHVAQTNPRAWLAGLRSVWSPAGEVVHAARYELRDGLADFRFTLPADAGLVAATDSEGNRLVVREAEGREHEPGERDYAIDLSNRPAAEPLERNSPSLPSVQALTITYREPIAGAASIVSPTLPRSGVDGIGWEWTMLTPTRWNAKNPADIGLGWRARLLGPLARDASSRPFNPLEQSEWWRLVRLASEPGAAFSAAARRLSEPAPGGDRLPVESLDGWRQQRFIGSLTPPPPVRLIDLRQRRLVCVAVALLVAAAAAWRLTPHPRRYTTTLGIAAIAALLTPDTAAPIASSVWFGLLLATPFSWLAQAVSGSAPSTPATASEATRPTMRDRIGPAMTALLLGLVSANPAEADTPTDNLGDEVAQVEQVLIPIDDQRRPVSDKYYIRDAFLKRLLEREDARDGAASAAAAILGGASVRGELLADAATDEVRVGAWALAIELRTLRRNARIRLAINKTDADWASSVSIDGVPTPLTWDAQGQAAFVVAEPGACRATLEFRPRITVADGESCVQMRLPPLPAVEFDLKHPPSLADVRTPFARSFRRAAPERLRATLANSGELLLCWTEPQAKSSELIEPVEVLQWIDVTAEAVTAKVKVIAPTDAEPVKLTVPLGWTSLDSPDSRQLEVTPHRAGTTAKGAGGEVVRFRVDRSSALGQLRVKPLVIDGAEVRRQLAALSLGPGLRRGPEVAAEAARVETQGFASAWSSGDGPGSVTPDYAANLTPGDDWVVAIEPQDATPGILSQNLAVVVGADGLLVQLRLNNSRDSKPLQAIRVPADFRVESVEVGERPARWSRPSTGRLVVFPTGGSGWSGEVKVLGSLPRTEGVFATPRLEIDDGPTDEGQTDGGSTTDASPPLFVSIYRNDDVLVEVDSEADEDGASLLLPASWRARPVATFRSPPGAELPALTVKLNRPIYTASVLTRYSDRDEQTVARCMANVAVEAGSLGSLPIAIDAPLNAELELIAPTDARLLDAPPGLATRRLQLANPVGPGETLSLVIEVRTASVPRGDLPASPIAMPEAQVGTTTLAVPIANDSRGLRGTRRWSVLGYRESEAAPKAAAKAIADWSADEGQWRFFVPQSQTSEETAPRGRVFWIRAKETGGRLSCPLAEHELVAPPYGEAVLTSRFAIRPGGVGRIKVAIPAPLELRTTSIDGVDALLKRGSAGDWTIDLRSPETPQVVTLTLVAPGVGAGLPVPVLSTAAQGSVSPERALWAVRRRVGQTIQPPPNGRIATQETVSFLRLRIYEPLATAVGDPPAAWLRVWAPRLSSLAESAERNDVYGVLSLEDEDASAEQADASVASSYRRLNDWLAQREASPSPSESSDPFSTPDNREWTYCVVDSPGVGDRVTPSFIDATTGDLAARVSLALLAAIALVAGQRRVSDAGLQEAFRDYRHAFAAVGGVLWWLLLEPSFVGLAVLAASALGQARLLLRWQ